MPEGIAARRRVTGLKETRRAVESGRAATVFLACDAEARLTEPLRQLCREAGVAVEEGRTMRELGRAAGIAVGTAAMALLAE